MTPCNIMPSFGVALLSLRYSRGGSLQRRLKKKRHTLLSSPTSPEGKPKVPKRGRIAPSLESNSDPI